MLITVFNLPKTRLFIPGKVKLAKNMLCLTTFFHLCDHYISKYLNFFVFRRKILATHKEKLFIVWHAFNAVIKCDYNVPGLFIPGKVKLAKNMLCLTTFFHLCDHYFSKYFNLFVLRRKILATHKKKLFIVWHAFSVVIKCDYNVPGLFIPGKVKLAKYMLCLTTFFHLGLIAVLAPTFPKVAILQLQQFWPPRLILTRSTLTWHPKWGATCYFFNFFLP